MTAAIFAGIFAFSPVFALGACGGSNNLVPDGSTGLCLPASQSNAATDANAFLISIINVMLSVAAIIAVMFIIIGGYRYITSAGNEETAEKGRNTLVNAIIGLVIIILAYVIVGVVNNSFADRGILGGLIGGRSQ